MAFGVDVLSRRTCYGRSLWATTVLDAGKKRCPRLLRIPGIYAWVCFSGVLGSPTMGRIRGNGPTWQIMRCRVVLATSKLFSADRMTTSTQYVLGQSK
jgi:hypothetical protein